MSEIAISAADLMRLRQELERDTEWGAALFLNSASSGERFLVQGWEVASNSDVTDATATEITFAPQFLSRCSRIARDEGWSLALLHTHPTGAYFFSEADNRAEDGLVRFMLQRNPLHQAFSMVLCDGALLARIFGQRENIPVRVVGANVELHSATTSPLGNTNRYDRQVRAFGAEGQGVLQNLVVGIVGLGGTGSVLAQQLAHLGVGALILIDPDLVEDTNLNRVVGASPGSVGKSKVAIATEMIVGINPHARVEQFVGSALTDPAKILLCKANCIFMCTDSHSSRAFLSELAYQYLIPAFDIGVSITAEGETVKAITGRIQMLGPGLPCLLCSNSLDPRRIREELMTPTQRAADPYFNAGAVAQPAVISINSMAVSLAVTMFLSAFTGIPSENRWLSYDGINSGLRKLKAAVDEDCAVCGRAHGVTALGDRRALTFLA